MKIKAGTEQLLLDLDLARLSTCNFSCDLIAQVISHKFCRYIQLSASNVFFLLHLINDQFLLYQNAQWLFQSVAFKFILKNRLFLYLINGWHYVKTTLPLYYFSFSLKFCRKARILNCCASPLSNLFKTGCLSCHK